MHSYVFIIVFSLCLPPLPLHPLPPHFNPPHEIHLMPEVREHAKTLLFISLQLLLDIVRLAKQETTVG